VPTSASVPIKADTPSGDKRRIFNSVFSSCVAFPFASKRPKSLTLSVFPLNVFEKSIFVFLFDTAAASA